MLPLHAGCVLSRLLCNGHSLLLGSYLSKIGRNENPSCSACGHSSQDTSHLILHCPATDSLATLCLWTTSAPALGSCPASGPPGSSFRSMDVSYRSSTQNLKRSDVCAPEKELLHHLQLIQYKEFETSSSGAPESQSEELVLNFRCLQQPFGQW